MTITPAISYPWYARVSADEPLEQGDFILNCQILQPDIEASDVGQDIRAEVMQYDVLGMSQSCDLREDKIELVLVCPFYTLTEYGNNFSEYKTPNAKENLRKGRRVGIHLLDKLTTHGIDDFLVVDFKSIYALPIRLLRKIAISRGERNRLLPPYREHLSQDFARFFMRVGLPMDIPPFK